MTGEQSRRDIRAAEANQSSSRARINNADLFDTTATFPSLPLLRGSSDVVRARITKAAIACQNIASAVAVFERVILAVPIYTTRALVDHRAPRSLGGLRVSRAETYRCKSGGSHQNRAHPLFQPPVQGFVITPRRLSLFQSLIDGLYKSQIKKSRVVGIPIPDK
jgi:hypothetical protein